MNLNKPITIVTFWDDGKLNGGIQGAEGMVVCPAGCTHRTVVVVTDEGKMFTVFEANVASRMEYNIAAGKVETMRVYTGLDSNEWKEAGKMGIHTARI